MKHAFLALLLILGAEGVALACSCIPAPTDPAQARAAAREVARNVVAIVEADVVTGYDRQRQRGETVRVRRVLAGRAPRAFRVHRNGEPNSAACGVELQAGARKFLILHRSRTTAPSEPVYAIQSLCTDYWVQNARFRDMLVAELRRRP